MTTRQRTHVCILEAANPHPIVTEQKRLAKRIKKLYRRINRLKTRHNELAFISRLPPELLTRIFSILQSNTREEYGQGYYKWAVVTQVTRPWRRLALGTKHLWNIVSHTTKTPQSPWVAVSLERSQPLSVDVVVDFDLTGEHLSFLNTIAQHNHRMRTTRVNITGWSTEKFRKLQHLLSWLEVEAPLLTILKLTGTDATFEPNITHFRFFNSLAPCLQSIHLTGINLYLHALPFRNITSLILLYPPGHQGVLSLSVLFDILRTTRLQTLKLQYALSWRDDDPELANPTPIPIPSVSILFLDLPPHQCTTLLSHLVVPPSCSVFIWGCFLPNPGNVQVPTTQAFFDTTLAYFSSDPTEFIALDITIQETVVTFGLRRQQDFQGGAWTDSISLEIGFAYPRTATGESLSFPSLSPFSNMWAVLLSGSPRDPADTAISELISTVSTLPALAEVALSTDAVAGFSNHLHNNSGSFGSVVLLVICINSMEENPVPPLRELERVLTKYKEIRSDRIAVRLEVVLGWTEKNQLPELFNRLRGLCDLAILEF
ncbi:hypothetical protein BDN72DRAFT_843530 [Pluteus cervinus]|uniref:Uncharacterized protein n=1 Tax=Pluteus cervinus TaxID=181527 RepID=A0ACD3ANG1_9AGAR|nr:hypothetical protein BDN72DRAFT_843530 [Pluteus cervinus]